jgi:hypothetical protein
METRTNGQTSGDFWAVTSYFNPLHYESRLVNYRIFRDRLQIPLVTVELGYGPIFELQPGDAEILVQRRGTAVLWQKERLLNIALQALPASCRNVAWLDCDIFFESAYWVEAAQSLLDRFLLIQLFSRVHNLGRPWAAAEDYHSQIEYTRPSAASTVGSGVPAAVCIGHQFDRRKGTCSPGFAWAARRELIERHGFFDSCVVGGGDGAMTSAAYYCVDELMQRHHMNERQKQRYVSWAQPYYGSTLGQIGFVDADIYHLWHGDIELRRPRARHEGLRRFEFDPYRDIAFDESFAWRWNSDKSEMHDYIRSYFAARLEDGSPEEVLDDLTYQVSDFRPK